jgi:phosphoenolpyruvate carboxykinase (ATP)
LINQSEEELLSMIEQQMMSPKWQQDLTAAELVQLAAQRKEGITSASGALVVTTGKRTGRSPKDRFIVKDSMTADSIAWGNINQPIEAPTFDQLWQKAWDYLSNQEAIVSHLSVGASAQHGLQLQVITETAWHSLFAQHMFITTNETLQKNEKSWTILHAANLTLDPAQDGTNSDGVVIINISQRKVLICGIAYAGEMKKAMFTVLNYLLPEKEILPMHCAANIGKQGDVALFFGLSGTGKTTLSADPQRYLIGDDEHGWSAEHVFNFEGGCYAKCINLSKEKEPMIWDAIRDGAIMENVILDGNTLEPDFTNDSLTQNTRAAYPRKYIPNHVKDNQGGLPSNVIFLTCDLYGVLPPVSKLSQEQAAYYFLSGYTAHVGSTEIGSSGGVKPTFSTCFGAPFFPRPATVYADLLIKRIVAAGCDVYLVNTGWTGGAYGEGGERFDIPTTRRIIDAILKGELKNSPMEMLPLFNLCFPKQLSGVEAKLLNPRLSWQNQADYEAKAKILIKSFKDNFAQFEVGSSIINAAPALV